MSEAQYSCENWWFDETERGDEQSDGEGTNSTPGSWQRRKRAHRIARFAVTGHLEPVARDSYLENGREVSLADERVFLPQQYEDGERTREVYQEPEGRRYNPKTGRVAGEGTAAYIPEFSKDVFEAASHAVLAGTDKQSYLSILLSGIGYIEDQRENPPLTVLAVYADRGTPADAFGDLVERFGLPYRTPFSDATIKEMIDDVWTHDWT